MKLYQLIILLQLMNCSKTFKNFPKRIVMKFYAELGGIIKFGGDRFLLR